MKYGKLNIKKVIMALFLLFVIVSLIIFLLHSCGKKNEGAITNSSSSPVSVKIEEIVSKIKLENGELEYESTHIPEIISLVFKENERYKNIIVDTKTGKTLDFKDIIKEDKWDDFLKKETELLNLKYPSFIVDGISNSDGLKIYYVKDNEMILFYYDYSYSYDYSDIVSLKIDYNEIKDYLNFTPVLNDTYNNEDGYNYVSDKKTIALTFDDGPSRKYNPLILEELSRNKAHATFFMVGNMMNSCQTCVLQTINSGNEVGSHTYEHMNIKNNSISSVNNSLQKTDEVYYKITGGHIKLVRPPYGAYNKTNLQNVSNPFVLWNLDTEDWRYRDVNHIVNYVKDNAKDGAIILMHELYETSYEALKILLPWLYANGYQVVSVSELANLKNHPLEVGRAYTSIR